MYDIPIRLKPVPNCPECGELMRLIRPRDNQDWNPFWGCNRYPRCKGTMNIDEITGEPVDKYDDMDISLDDMF